MLLVLPELEIASDEGFSEQRDIFKRKHLADGLTRLLSTASGPLVLALDGPRGCGKTTFLKMWAGERRENGFSVIYCHAFEHDFVDDPFRAFAGEIIALGKQSKSVQATAREKLVEKAKGVGKVLLRGGLKV